jgi:5-oxoprolinase (ATP-hydrolysing)
MHYSVYFESGREADTPVFELDKLEVGDEVQGPAVVIDDTQTIVVIPGARALLTRKHLYIELDK